MYNCFNLAILLNPQSKLLELYSVSAPHRVEPNPNTILWPIVHDDCKIKFISLQSKRHNSHTLSKKEFLEQLVSHTDEIGFYTKNPVIEDDLVAGDVVAIHCVYDKTAEVYTVVKVRGWLTKFFFGKFKVKALNGPVFNTDEFREGKDYGYYFQTTQTKKLYRLKKKRIIVDVSYKEGIANTSYSFMV